MQNFLKKKEGIYSPIDTDAKSCVTKSVTERECPTMYNMGMGGYLKKRNRRSGGGNKERSLALGSFTMALGAFAIGNGLALITFFCEKISVQGQRM